MAEIRYKGQIYSGAASFGSADDVSYDNSTSGLTATDVQDALDEVVTRSDYKVNAQLIEDTDSTGSQYKSNASVTADSISGYSPIGVVGWKEQTTADVLFYGLSIEAGNVRYSWQTINNSVVKNHKFYVYVLYKKN